MTVELARTYRAPATARAMADAALRFLDSLSDEYRQATVYPFAGDERYIWNYRPTAGGNSAILDRKGLRIISMTPEQQELALALYDTGLSERAAQQARTIMQRENILREHERIEGRLFSGVRDNELYWWTIFGEPGGAAPWAWRVGGHHIALHFTIVDREMVASTPLFLGANPAEVKYGELTGHRALPEEEDLPRALAQSLQGADRARAVFTDSAPTDIMTDASRVADRFTVPRGLSYAAMSGEQRAKLMEIVKHYVTRVNAELSAQEWDKVERAGLETITFAWGGPVGKGAGHYYAIQGPTFLIEYDNTQNNANHIHSVWRTFAGDWGEDILAQHYAESHGGR